MGRAGAKKPPGVHYSPSQIETRKSCPRKHAFDAIFGYREEEQYAASWGTAGHSHVEALLRGEAPKVPHPRFLGLEPRIERYFSTVVRPFLVDLDIIGSLGIEYQIQARFQTGDLDRWWWTFLDLVFPVRHADFDVVVWDHKTMKDLRWAKTEWELQENLQMLTCAYHSPVKGDRYLLVHGQVQREGKIDQRKTTTVVTHQKVVDTWNNRVLPIIQEIESDRRNASFPGDFATAPGGPGVASACSAYGGCPYLASCKLCSAGRDDWEAPIQHLRKAVNFEDLEENVVLNPPDSTRQPEGSPYLTVDNLEDLLRKSVQQTAPAAQKEQPMSALDDLLKTVQKNTPPPAQPSAPPPAAAPPPVTPPSVAMILAGAGRGLDAVFGSSAQVGGPGPFGAPTAPITPPTSEAAAEPPKKGRGRPRKDKPAEGAGPSAPADAPTQPIALEAPVDMTYTPPVGDLAKQCNLYIDCRPFNVRVFSFEEIVAPILEQLAKMKFARDGAPDANGISYPDWRMIPYSNGPAYVRTALRTFDLPLHVVVDTKNPLACDCLEVLRVRAMNTTQRF